MKSKRYGGRTIEWWRVELTGQFVSVSRELLELALTQALRELEGEPGSHKPGCDYSVTPTGHSEFPCTCGEPGSESEGGDE